MGYNTVAVIYNDHTHLIEVSVDETKFTPEFMAEFKATMYPFDSVYRHI